MTKLKFPKLQSTVVLEEVSFSTSRRGYYPFSMTTSLSLASSALSASRPQYRCTHRLSLGAVGDELDVVARISLGVVSASDGAPERFATAVVFSPCGSLLLVGCNDGTVLVWEMGTLTLCTALAAHDGPVTALAPPDARTDAHRSRVMATGGSDCAVRLWDVETAQLLHALTVPSFPLCVLVSPLGWPPHLALQLAPRCLVVVLCADDAPLLFDTSASGGWSVTRRGLVQAGVEGCDAGTAAAAAAPAAAAAAGSKRTRAEQSREDTALVVGTSACWGVPRAASVPAAGGATPVTPSRAAPGPSMVVDIDTSSDDATDPVSSYLYIGTERGTVEKHDIALLRGGGAAPSLSSVLVSSTPLLPGGEVAAVKTLSVLTGRQLNTAPGCCAHDLLHGGAPVVPTDVASGGLGIADDAVVYMASTDDGLVVFAQEATVLGEAGSGVTPGCAAAATLDDQSHVAMHALCASPGAGVLLAAHRINNALRVSVWSRERAQAAVQGLTLVAPPSPVTAAVDAGLVAGGQAPPAAAFEMEERVAAAPAAVATAATTTYDTGTAAAAAAAPAPTPLPSSTTASTASSATPADGDGGGGGLRRGTRQRVAPRLPTVTSYQSQPHHHRQPSAASATPASPMERLARSYAELSRSSFALPAPSDVRDRVMSLAHHPLQAMAVVATRHGRLLLFSRQLQQSWTAFAPFLTTEELVGNLPYRYDPVRDGEEEGAVVDAAAAATARGGGASPHPRPSHHHHLHAAASLAGLRPAPMAAPVGAAAADNDCGGDDGGEEVDLVGGGPGGQSHPVVTPLCAPIAGGSLDLTALVAVGSHVPFCLPLKGAWATAAAAVMAAEEGQRSGGAGGDLGAPPLPGDVPVLFTSTAYVRRRIAPAAGGAAAHPPSAAPAATPAMRGGEGGGRSTPFVNAEEALHHYLHAGVSSIVSITQRDVPIYWLAESQ